METRKETRMPQDWRLLLAKLIMVAALACGIIGLVAGLSDKEWKLGVTGWFTGGTLVAVLSLVILADHYFETRRKQT